jgi:hypothetical protein
MTQRYREAQVPRLRPIAWLKRSGLWQAAASATPSRLRPLIRRTLVRKPGTTRMDPADRKYLVGYYREDIRSLSTLVNRDLSHWLTDNLTLPAPNVPSTALSHLLHTLPDALSIDPSLHIRPHCGNSLDP